VVSWCVLHVKHAALLHDVVEDTTYGFQDLRLLGYTKRTRNLVWQVTRLKGETRGVYFARMLEENDPDGLCIKYCDLMHNTDPNRGHSHPDESMRIMYAEKKATILDALYALDNQPTLAGIGDRHG